MTSFERAMFACAAAGLLAACNDRRDLCSDSDTCWHWETKVKLGNGLFMCCPMQYQGRSLRVSRDRITYP